MDLKKLMFEEEILPPEGEYEAIILEACFRNYNSGNEGIGVTLMIRNDIEQECQDMELTDQLVKTKAAIYKFRMIRNAIPKVIEHPWENLQELAKLIVAQPVRIYVKHREDVYGQTVASISSYKKGEPFELDEEYK
ncbi:DUF669 domain-containing protein [Paenibacillus sp. FSL H8-0537]|uniref:DUF669 domain-containing protein n=1 Tax=Paenibacillus sp. FSL H8-0537 TaxID=2921399 RepID=UPI00310105CB